MNVDVFVFPLIHILHVLQNTPVPFENSSFLAILWLQMPLFDPYGMCAGRGLLRATPIVTSYLGFRSLTRKTTPMKFALNIIKGYLGLILTRVRKGGK